MAGFANGMGTRLATAGAASRPALLLPTLRRMPFAQSLARKRTNTWLEIAWYVGVLVSILLVPLWTRLGEATWRLAPHIQLQSWVWAVAWLGFAVGLSLARFGSGTRSLAMAGGLLIACFALGYAVLRLIPGAHVSKSVAVLSTTLAVTLGLIPLVLTRSVAVFGAAVLFGGAALLAARRGSESIAAVTTDMQRASSRYLLTISADSVVTEAENVKGGAVEAHGDGFLVASGAGSFHFVRLRSDSGSIAITNLPIPSPLNRDAFVADQRNPSAVPLFRLTDIAVTAGSSSLRLYAAHQYWHSDQKCVTIRVSVTDVDPSSWAATPWVPVYETRPCVPMTGAYEENETGGRLAWQDGLLLTLGDLGFSIVRGIAQDSSADYGKILKLDLRGGRTIFSIGHRNPQGLLVARDGRIWSTEHGPMGGDEINVIRKGGNYGWPLETHGTQYGLRYWPLKRDSASQSFVEPAHAFVPSIGITALVELGDGPLASWKGNLLAGSLIGRSLFRISVVDDRVVSTERIDVGHRVRDIAQGNDGRIVLWTDEGNLLTVTESRSRPAGEVAYAQCAGCHGADLSGTANGPSLRSLFSRQIADVEGFVFSPALRSLDGRWTMARLDEFLRNPAEYAKGTTMRFAGIADAAERQALLNYLLRNH